MKYPIIRTVSHKVCTGKSNIKQLMEENNRIHLAIREAGYRIILRSNSIIANSKIVNKTV